MLTHNADKLFVHKCTMIPSQPSAITSRRKRSVGTRKRPPPVRPLLSSTDPRDRCNLRTPVERDREDRGKVLLGVRTIGETDGVALPIRPKRCCSSLVRRCDLMDTASNMHLRHGKGACHAPCGVAAVGGRVRPARHSFNIAPAKSGRMKPPQGL